jgi:hypothetical protein
MFVRIAVSLCVEYISILHTDSNKEKVPIGSVLARQYHSFNRWLMVGHLAAGVADPPKALAYCPTDPKPCLPVALLQIDVLVPVAAGGHMVEGTRKLNTKRPCHT